MTEPRNDFERLVSRYLDEECSPEERRQLESLLHRDRDAEAFFEETAALDREIGRLMRQSLGRSVVVRRPAARWRRAMRYSALAVAACAGLLLSPQGWWSIFGPPAADEPGESGRQPARASWFAPPPAGGDIYGPDARPFERAQVRVDKSDREWIVVPSERPGEFLVVEVKRVKTRTIPVQEDF